MDHRAAAVHHDLRARLVAAGGRGGGQVGARAERCARTGQHDHPNGGPIRGRADAIAQFGQRGEIDRVPAWSAVDRQRRTPPASSTRMLSLIGPPFRRSTRTGVPR